MVRVVRVVSVRLRDGRERVCGGVDGWILGGGWMEGKGAMTRGGTKRVASGMWDARWNGCNRTHRTRRAGSQSGRHHTLATHTHGVGGGPGAERIM